MIKWLSNLLDRIPGPPPGLHRPSSALDELQDIDTNQLRDAQLGQVWTIDKEVGFDYGHRVHNQRLNKAYSMDDACVCKHLHGHRGRVHIYLESNELDGGFVTDFKHLNWVKSFLDDHVDHKFILDRSDPWFSQIINLAPQAGVVTHPHSLRFFPTVPFNTTNSPHLLAHPVFVPGTNLLTGYELDVIDMAGPEKEFFESFFFVSFVPTSENLSKWLFDIVDARMSLINIKTVRIDWWETPKSKSTYTRR